MAEHKKKQQQIREALWWVAKLLIAVAVAVMVASVFDWVV